MSYKSNQRGVAAVEVILIAVIIALLGFVGWFVWHSNQQTKATLDAASKSAASSPAKAATTQQYTSIKEWGVKGKSVASITLMYKLSTAPDAAVFTSKELDDADSACASSADGGGKIERYTADEQVVYEDGLVHGTTAAQFAKEVDAGQATLPYTHIGAYYYFYIHSQGLCGSNTQTVQQLQGKTSDAVRTFLKSLQAV